MAPPAAASLNQANQGGVKNSASGPINNNTNSNGANQLTNSNSYSTGLSNNNGPSNGQNGYPNEEKQPTNGASNGHRINTATMTRTTPTKRNNSQTNLTGMTPIPQAAQLPPPPPVKPKGQFSLDIKDDDDDNEQCVQVI
jgi:hypothetical protein